MRRKQGKKREYRAAWRRETGNCVRMVEGMKDRMKYTLEVLAGSSFIVHRFAEQFYAVTLP